MELRRTGRSTGKRVPVSEQIPGRSFRLRRYPENESHSELRFRVVVSARGIIRKLYPSLSVDSGTRFPPGLPLGKRVPACVAKAFSLRPRPAWSSILRGTGGGFTDVGHGGLRFDKHRIHIGLIVCAENPRICFANTHRLRPPAGVLARGLKTLTRFLYARALHRVRFSAVSICNKKAGRCVYLPACNYWWRRGESNSGPRRPPDWHLQAQSLV